MSALATLLAGVALALGGDEVTLGWRGKESTTAALPEDLPKPARDAIAAWEDWCVEHKYRFDLDEKGKVLFVSRASSGRSETYMALVQQVVTLFALSFHWIRDDVDGGDIWLPMAAAAVFLVLLMVTMPRQTDTLRA